jgi:hypothetical protein
MLKEEGRREMEVGRRKKTNVIIAMVTEYAEPRLV